MIDTRKGPQLPRRWRRPCGSLLGAVAVCVCVVVTPGSARAEKPGADPWILADAKTYALSVFRNGRLLDRFHNVAIGPGGISPDRVHGDGTTPLGTFHIDRRIHDEFDWTRGCIALTNDPISRPSLYVSPGMRVEVR